MNSYRFEIGEKPPLDESFRIRIKWGMPITREGTDGAQIRKAELKLNDWILVRWLDGYCKMQVVELEDGKGYAQTDIKDGDGSASLHFSEEDDCWESGMLACGMRSFDPE